MPLITDIPQAEEQFRRTFLSETVQPIAMAQTTTDIARQRCYLVTASDFCEETLFRNDYVLLTSEGPLTPIDKQFNFVSLSQAMFKDAMPLEGVELAMLNKAYSKYFSKTPTRL